MMLWPTWIGRVAGFVRRYPGRVAVGTAGLLVLLAVAWLPGPRRLPASRAGADRAQVPKPEPDSRAQTAAVLGERLPPPARKSNELCGYGPVPLDEHGIAQIPPEIRAEGDAALGRLGAELAARPADRDRAMGLYLQMVAAGTAAADARSSSHGECAESDEPCRSAAFQAGTAVIAPSRQALVQLAMRTTDADAYALATFSCFFTRDQSPPDECSLLNSGQWARIEPDNAIPWLYAADAAAERHDRSGVEAALYRASKSRYSDPHHDQMARLLASDPLGAQPLPVQAQTNMLLIGIGAAFPTPGYNVLEKYCGSDDAADPARLQTCGDLAAVLIEHGRSNPEVWVGNLIVKRVGGTDPRLSRLGDEADAFLWQAGQDLMVVPSHTAPDCEWMRQLRTNMTEQARSGEAARVWRELAASGLTPPQAAELLRARIRAGAAKNVGDAKVP